MKSLARFLSGSMFAIGAFTCLAGAASAQRPEGGGPATYADRETAWNKHQQLMEASLTPGLEWRSVGPVVQGGRVADIETVPGEPYTFYVAYSSGGLWKTTNNGVSFEPIFDHEATNVIGDVAVDPSNPETIWVGTGEPNSSRSSYGGLGMYRSDDGGVTWRRMGLDNSDRIGRVLVDPRDSKRVFVAVLGKLYTPGGERGVYRTTDGGSTWEQVLAGDEVTGFVDLAMDPTDSEVLYAAAWERSRTPWEFVEGGNGSAIWKSSDGGDSWRRLEGGFPQGEHVGRIGLSIAASQPQTVYAALEPTCSTPTSVASRSGARTTPARPGVSPTTSRFGRWSTPTATTSDRSGSHQPIPIASTFSVFPSSPRAMAELPTPRSTIPTSTSITMRSGSIPISATACFSATTAVSM
ncbi:MAG: hypothetical protein P8Y44_05255 [Acidobacteriota bacterium]